MYFGSVRFFKHLILSTVALMIIVPTVLAVYFGASNHKNKLYAEELENQISSAEQAQTEVTVVVVQAIAIGFLHIVEGNV